MAFIPEAQRPIFSHCVQQTVKVTSPVHGNYGTGIILSDEGLIITASHVIGKAKHARIQRCWLEPDEWKIRNSGRYTADVIANFPGADVAVLLLRKPPKKLRPATVGDSDRLRPGLEVLRIGHDVHQFSNGHVFGFCKIGRYTLAEMSMATDTGASGGPVFDFESKSLLGMILRARTEPKRPLSGLAIPINEVMRIITGRRVVRDLLTP